MEQCFTGSFRSTYPLASISPANLLAEMRDSAVLPRTIEGATLPLVVDGHLSAGFVCAEPDRDA
jgi:hypothetical protein